MALKMCFTLIFLLSLSRNIVLSRERIPNKDLARGLSSSRCMKGRKTGDLTAREARSATCFVLHTRESLISFRAFPLLPAPVTHRKLCLRENNSARYLGYGIRILSFCGIFFLSFELMLLDI